MRALQKTLRLERGNNHCLRRSRNSTSLQPQRLDSTSTTSWNRCMGCLESNQFSTLLASHFSSRRNFMNENAEDIAQWSNSARASTFSTTRTFDREVETESEWRQLVADVENQEMFPIGELSVEEFIGIEKTLKWGLVHIPLSRETIEGSFALFRRLIQEHEANYVAHRENYEMTHWFDGNYPRSVNLLDEILKNWSRWWIRNPKEEALNPENVLALVDNLRSGDPPLPLTDKTFGIIIAAATKAANPGWATFFADRLLDKMLDESIDCSRLRPTNITLSKVFNAWAKSGLPEAPEKIDALLHKMKKLYEDHVLDEHPDNSAHEAVMQAWSSSGRKEAPYKVEEILETMKNSTSSHVSPTIPAYRLAIHSWVNSEKNFASIRAYTLFVELMDLYMGASDERMEIDTDFFSVIIAKLARERKTKEAEEVFHLLEQLAFRDSRFEPTPRVLLGMVIAYSKSNQSSAVKKAESLLLELQERAEANDDFLSLPKRGYYYNVILGLSKSKLPDGADRAESLLYKMIDLHLLGAPAMLPDRPLFEAVISAFARQNQPGATERAEALLRTMQQLSVQFQTGRTKPNSHTYLHVITAWSRSKDTRAPERSEQLFYDMLQQYNAGDRSMKPSVEHYTTLISCWSRSGHPDAPNRAQTIFDAAMELFNDMGRSFKPDRFLYSSLMQAWSTMGEARVVENIFLEMLDNYSKHDDKRMMPNTVCFNIMLQAWSRSGSPEAHQKAKLIFESMLEFTEDKKIDVPPDGLTFQLVIDIMSKSRAEDSAELADKYLKMFKASKLSSDRRALPFVFPCYVSTISSWSKSKNPNAASRADALIGELVELVKTRALPLPSKSEYIHFLATVAKSEGSGKSRQAEALLSQPHHELRVTRDLLSLVTLN